MTSLLQLAFLKALPYKPLLVMLGLFTLILPLGYYAIGDFPLDINKQQINLSVLYDFPDIWYYVCYAASWFNLFFGIIVITLVTNEISDRTLRQNVIDGLSRDQLVIEKLLLIAVLGLVGLLVATVTGFVFGLLNSAGTETALITEKILYLPAYYIQLFAYMTAALLVGLSIKKTGFAIVLYIGYTWVEMIVNGIITYFNKDLGGWLPHAALSSITVFPARHLNIDPQLQSINFNIPGSPLDQHLYLTLVYIVIFAALCFNAVRSRDLN